MSTSDWHAINHANWESRVAIHAAPGGYNLDAFDDPTHLSGVVRHDLPRMGRLDDLDVVHLQCHIGTDTVSLARLGAKSVVGLDFSASALEVARQLSARGGNPVEFVHADAYDAVDVLGAERFDLVYTGIGAICWLPSIERWAQVVAGLVRPGGRLFMREGHPMLWTMCDPRPDGLLVVEFPYFETEGTLFTEEETYGGDGLVGSPTTVGFNHGIAEILRAVREAGLELTGFEEHREVPWNPLGDAMVESRDLPGEWVLASAPERMPLSYTLQATKPA